MNPWAIIPVKPFALGKSRLAGMLDADARARLNRRLFERVFGATCRQLGPEHVVVVTADAALLASVAGSRAHALQEQPTGNLNAALAQATRHAIQQGAEAIIVLPADLPDLDGADVAALAGALGPAPSCVLAPDRAEQGTNGLALRPPDPEFFRFGPASFAEHLQMARTRGLEPAIVRRPGLAHDLDTPESYRRFAERNPSKPGVET